MVCGRNGFAKLSLQENRFKFAIDQVYKAIETVYAKNENFDQLPPAEQAGVFTGSGLRIKAFNLQSLGRMYQNSENKELRKFAINLRDATKSLEDQLGNVDMYKNVSKPAEQVAAAKKLISALKKEQWIKNASPGEIFALWREEMSEINWASDKKDREFVIGAVFDQLTILLETDYDMNYLNSGLHELRRELRWFSLDVIAADGVIQKSAEDEFVCRQQNLPFKQFADPKYSSLARKEYPDACFVSACIYDEIVGAIGIFGLLKDKAEKIVERDEDLVKEDLTPEEIKEEALKYYELLIETEILDTARNELKSCLQEK